MMKSLIVLFSLMLGLGVAALAQESRYQVSDGGTLINAGSRDIIFECFTNTAFSQVEPGFNNGFFADETPGYCNRVAEDYEVAGPFSAMRLWAGNFYGCEAGESQTLVFDFYDGVPENGGNLIHSFQKNITPIPVGEFSISGNVTEIYRIDVDFGQPIQVLNGWVSVRRINPADGCAFAWVGIAQSGNSLSNCGGSWFFSDGKLLFCLGEMDQEVAIPVSGWALLIGISLILALAVIRFRRLI